MYAATENFPGGTKLLCLVLIDYFFHFHATIRFLHLKSSRILLKVIKSPHDIKIALRNNVVLFIHFCLFQGAASTPCCPCLHHTRQKLWQTSVDYAATYVTREHTACIRESALAPNLLVPSLGLFVCFIHLLKRCWNNALHYITW